MNAQDAAYLLELQVALRECELSGDIPSAEIYQQMIQEFEENCED